jgi:lysophospholipase L1-like esterase
MVGGGLCRALAPRFGREGTKLVRDVWESGSIEAFAESDRIPKLIARHDPDLVLLNLGANDVGGTPSPILAKKIAKVAALTQEGGPRDCVWIGPPRWKVDGTPIVALIKEHAFPCTFFDSTDIEMHRKPDKIHPDEKGGDEWAIAFWRFFRGPDADPGTFDVARGILR